ncbi:MAG: hydantoinase/oxoprolinase family protein [Gammaproteobacteria bacterium]|nr:hydantoinase/oxoprolinase family protein [Gammaproteobacteria bacterium]
MASRPAAHRIRLAVDIGGTFTDLVLATASGTLSSKVLTTAAAPHEGVLAGTSAILYEAGIAPGEVDLVIHGTTLATNALIERKGAKTALLATQGFRDAIEMAYEHRFEQYDLYMERPQPLVPRHLRIGIEERMSAAGDVLLPLNEAAVAAAAARCAQEDIEAIAVGFLHSYVNRTHEQRAGELLATLLPGIPITLSCDVCPEIREYERLSTACANAYVQPMMGHYLQALADGLTAQGLHCPLLLMMSSGGVTTVDTAIRQPIRLIESGPAGGVILAQHVAADAGAAAALSFDMGGTTAKLTFIDELQPQHSRTFEIARQYRFLKGSGLPVRIPVIDMVEIGAGGGSIARVDELRRISVGPDSAGAAPGPACYGNGGTAPTVTDADLVLGRIDAHRFADGRITLTANAAQAAIAADIATHLALDPETAAAGIAEIVDETMASAARVHAVENGKDTAGRQLIATGGAAPLHAARLAQKLNIQTIIVPVDASVGSAHGFLSAPIAYEVVRTRFTRLATLQAAAIDALFEEMRAEALTVVRLGAPDAALIERREAFMRYRGQGHEINVPLDNEPLDNEPLDNEPLNSEQLNNEQLMKSARRGSAAERLQARFEARYQTVFGRIIPALEAEIVTWTLTLSTAHELPPRGALPAPAPTPSPSGERTVFDPARGETVTARVFERAALSPGVRLSGPALIVEAQTTTVVPDDFEAAVSGPGHLVITRPVNRQGDA